MMELFWIKSQKLQKMARGDFSCSKSMMKKNSFKNPFLAFTKLVQNSFHLSFLHFSFFFPLRDFRFHPSYGKKKEMLSSISRLFYCQGSLINLKALIYTSFFSLRTSFQPTDQNSAII